MTFRTRLFLALAAGVLVPLLVLAIGVRREMTARLRAEYYRRLEAATAAIENGLRRRSGETGDRLAALAADLAADNRFRVALEGDETARRYRIDYAAGAMRLAGLAMLQIQDSAGRILSSGHFRNAYDELDPALPRRLSAAGDSVTLGRVRTAEGSILVLARIDSVELGGSRLTLVGGVAVDPTALGTGAVSVQLHEPGLPPRTPAGRPAADLAVPYVSDPADPVAADTARFSLHQSLAPLRELQRSVDRWFAVALALVVLGALLGAAWIARRVSRPITDLAEKTAAIDLDRLDQDFATDRDDEIGNLSRLLGTMTDRLRRSAASLREAERRAAVGDLARQVNHDVKNGLAPIRHVLRHLDQVARDEPAALAGVFGERRGTLESSLGYLETLARNYARLSPGLDRQPCDVNAVARQVVRGLGDRPELRLTLAEGLPPVRADEIVLRRIVENLVGNALDSLDGPGGGSVTVATELDASGARVRVVVADTGRGMSRAELDHAFEDFYTTKEGGTGLGLSIVRRLVLDLEGALRVETQPGEGSRFIVELPAAARA